jgi:cardiolipin synthase (CMP-forming)
MKRHIPNLLSICRMLFTVLLYPIIISGNRTLFLTLFLVTGFTDVLDGFLARRWKVQSRLGARLDSIADYVFTGSVPIWIILGTPSAIVQQYYLPFIIVAVVSALYLLVRINSPATFYHLYSAKLASVSIYVCALIIFLGYGGQWTVWLPASLVILAEIEELATIAGINQMPRRRP